MRDSISSHFEDKISIKRKDSVCAKSLLCTVLKEKFLLTDFLIRNHKNGKPYIVDSPLHFNLSHSGNYVLCLCGDEQVGCDIQVMKEYNERIVKRFFTESEFLMLNKSESKSRDFTRLWALKECILKFKGDGISGGLDTYDFSDFYHNKSFSAFGLEFLVTESDDYVISVCSHSGNIRIIAEKDIKLTD